jgi:aldehyde dehydrogenase (NAD+)
MIADSTVPSGGENDKSDLYIAPTLLDEPSFSSESKVTDEIFGPILPIITTKLKQIYGSLATKPLVPMYMQGFRIF